MIYPRLAFDNIRKNSRTYIPYILTCIFTVAAYYIVKSLSLNPGLNLSDAFGSNTAAYILELGSNIIAVFSFIFLFYTNSFLTKKRKKEFGLFNILGMEKKHISKVIGYESLYVFIISIVCGLGAGILLDKLMYAAVLRLIGTEVPFGFYISAGALKMTLMIFGIIFILIFINSLRMIHLSKPIELLKGGNTGEKEPKAKWFIALSGIICLGAGYYISLTIKNPVMALSLFFVAVILVIIGTYLLFTSGSIMLLKILKRNKRYYYKTSHFISVSGMMYRMKQNAVGLANICILSTMVLVTVSSTASLMAGIKGIVKERYPYQIELGDELGDIDISSKEKFRTAVHDIADAENVRITEETSYFGIQFQMIYDRGRLTAARDYTDLGKINNICNIFAVTAEDYSEYTGCSADINENEVIIWQNEKIYDSDSFDIFDKKFKITGHTDKFIDHVAVNKEICPTIGIVVKDFSVIRELYEKQKNIYGNNASGIEFTYGINIDGDPEKQMEFNDILLKKLRLKSGFMLNCREKSERELYSLYGGMFFLGIFLGLLFTMATALIIYYKQISEGIDDKERFEIMKKVGMSDREIKGSVRSQVLTIFFMPLVTAVIHTLFAFPIVRKILAMLQLTNVKLFVISTAAAFIAFAVIYTVIYMLTAKVYYRILRK